MEINGIPIGTGRCFIAVEAGINHNGDMEVAKHLIETAAEAGADAIKFQNYRTEEMVFEDSPLSITYRSQGEEVTERQYDLFKRHELTFEQLTYLKRYAAPRDIIFHSTPMSAEGVVELVRLGVPVMKNGSDCLGHLPLIRNMGDTGLPTVISTGMATVAEIDDAVRAFRSTGNDKLILLHCVSVYPANPEDANLSVMQTMQDVWRCPVGFSDHTPGNDTAIAAATLGAAWIEKHFTLDRSMAGPDHWFSLTPESLTELVTSVRVAEAARGDGWIGPKASEAARRTKHKLSCVAAHDMVAGDLITEGDITFQRTTTGGLAPKYFDAFVTKRLDRDMKRGEPYRL